MGKVTTGMRALLPRRTLAKLRSVLRGSRFIPPVGTVDFGDLRTGEPFSRRWGNDRGGAIDRHYIEGFLDRNRADVRGRVMEVGDATYIRRFGGDRVERIDVLNLNPGHPETTIVADLMAAEHVPGELFDCIIFTQTLQMMHDPKVALHTLRRLLKPGGVLLCTFPGITQTGDKDWRDYWHWSFTALSGRRLAGDVFGDGNVHVESHGNLLAAVGFLFGVSPHELTAEELDRHDPAYDLIIAVRAVKA
jgi:SAM-dependent methyltransferase